MTQQPSGWYEDPHDPSLYRYWDGVVWTDRVAPKTMPTLEQSRIGMPQAPDLQQPAGYGGPHQHGPRPGGWPGHQPPWAGQGQGYYALNVPTTPDGQLLAGWWRRVGARIIDGILTSVISGLVGLSLVRDIASIYSDWMRRVIDAAESGGGAAPTLPSELYAKVAIFGLISFAVYAVYEIVLLSVTGTTLGRRVTGISVRLRERPGPLPWGTSVVRLLVKEGGSLLGIVPLVGFVGSLFILLDSLFPLWDAKKQAIHDKAARTNVVVGQQPRNPAGPAA